MQATKDRYRLQGVALSDADFVDSVDQYQNNPTGGGLIAGIQSIDHCSEQQNNPSSTVRTVVQQMLKCTITPEAEHHSTLLMFESTVVSLELPAKLNLLTWMENGGAHKNSSPLDHVPASIS
jgi:hypothetical protein